MRRLIALTTRGRFARLSWRCSENWFADHQDTRDVIVKLHTGQGKTLIGLLMLQARLNAGKGPALYLCPDNFLIAQTCDQAKQFGIATCTADPELPDEFMNGDKILVTSVQKLFNGLTKFGLNRQSIAIETLLMDDAHACADTIREQCRIRIPSDEPAYHALRTLFADDLEMQGIGTYADICNEKRDALLPIPYWAWVVREAEIASILSTQRTGIRSSSRGLCSKTCSGTARASFLAQQSRSSRMSHHSPRLVATGKPNTASSCRRP